jgi:adenylylsulfate kinase
MKKTFPSSMNPSAWALWITGLPGSGKSTIAARVQREWRGRIQILRMDEIRKLLTPEPAYTEEERAFAYRALAVVGKYLVENNIPVIFDATAHRRAFREMGRSLISNFKEIYVKCTLEVAMKREADRAQDLVTRDLYAKALRRLKGEAVEDVGEVIGVDVTYEPPENPDLVIESDKIPPEVAAQRILALLQDR